MCVCVHVPHGFSQVWFWSVPADLSVFAISSRFQWNGRDGCFGMEAVRASEQPWNHRGARWVAAESHWVKDECEESKGGEEYMETAPSGSQVEKAKL